MTDLPIELKSNVHVGDTAPTIAELNAARVTNISADGVLFPNYVTPDRLNQYYRIGSNTGNSLASQGVYESNNQWFSPADLSNFQGFVGIPNEDVAVDIGGHSSDTACSDNGNGNCIEGNLDVQYLMGISQVTPTTYYYINDNRFIYDWLVAMASSTSPPLVMSVSWAGTENQFSASYMTSVNNEAIILSAMGVTLIAASGDDGANGKATSCGYVPVFPASSAYFTTVGGTAVGRIFMALWRRYSNWFHARVHKADTLK